MTIQTRSSNISTSSCILGTNNRRSTKMSDPHSYLLDVLCSEHPREFRLLRNEINWIVTEENQKSFYILDEEDKNRLIGLLFLALDNQSEWLAECKDADMIISSLGSFMIDNKENSREYFLSIISANAIRHWGPYLETLFDREVQEFNADKRSEYSPSLNVLTPNYDPPF